MNSYLIIKVVSKNISKFLHKCKDNNINIYSIKNISYKEIIIKINEKDYDKLLNIKYTNKYEIISSSGLLKFKELFNKNKIILLMSFIGLIILIVLSNVIFNVKIISDNNELNTKILKELSYYGIKKYSFKKDYNKISKIKDELKEKYKDNIEWLEITEVGTSYKVKIVERKKIIQENNSDYTNIIAKKSGIVKKIYFSSGQKQVELNTYVNKGDIIISGTIMKGEDIKDYVHAKGKVYAEIWYDVLIEFPLNYTEKVYTKNTKKSLYIKLNDKYIESNRFKNFERKNIISIKNKMLPFTFGIEKEEEVKIINDKYTINEAKEKAILKAEEKILQSLDKDEYILNEKVLNFTKKDSKIVLDMFFTCYEEISKEEKIIVEKE